MPDTDPSSPEHEIETAGADALAEHFATASPAELIESMRRLGTRFFQASEAFDKAMQRRHQQMAQQAVEVLMPAPAPDPPAPPPAATPAQPATNIPVSNGELINLGEVSCRLGLPMVTAQYLAQLGFEPEQRSKSARLYRAISVCNMAHAIRNKLIPVVLNGSAEPTNSTVPHYQHPTPAQPATNIPVSNGELINLGEVSRRLGLPMVTAQYLAQLGFEPEQRSKSARLYRAISVCNMAHAIRNKLIPVILNDSAEPTNSTVPHYQHPTQ